MYRAHSGSFSIVLRAVRPNKTMLSQAQRLDEVALGEGLAVVLGGIQYREQPGPAGRHRRLTHVLVASKFGKSTRTIHTT